MAFRDTTGSNRRPWLGRDGLVTLTKGGRIQLTSEGRKVAERTILRHHLIERILSEIFGMEWVDVRDEAERLEYAVSPSFEKRLVKVLGHKGPVLTEMVWP